MMTYLETCFKPEYNLGKTEQAPVESKNVGNTFIGSGSFCAEDSRINISEQ